MRRAIAAGALGAGMLTAAAALTCAVPSSVAYSADSVRWEQTNLAGLGYLPASGVDGVDGAQTHAALKQFQHDNGLAEDGAYGDRSELALHHQVGAVQSKSGSSADGLYGGGTATGVKNWQRAHNLSADGVAGAGTMRAMGIARTVWITAQNQIAARGWSVSTQFSCLEDLWNGESSWKVYATNPSSGAYGIPQALPATKMAAAGADWRTNPATQIKWGLGYIADVYGSPCAAYQKWQSRSPHWY